ncbi:MAG: mycofactocin biosynthesis chaperone MftB, partial [Acidimicrobiia bacterium]|nr:mycofactocin biosynthesis chaperone MftB [Acidimicrobiia bacterium]
MSTDPQPSDPTTGRWRLHRRVALRPEPFGALAYHYGNRKLNFLRSPELVRLVDNLEHFDSARAAFDNLDIDVRQWPSYGKALDALARSDFIEPLQLTPPTEPSPS